MKFGMGIRIVILEAKPGSQTSLAQLISEAKPSGKLILSIFFNSYSIFIA